LTPTAYASTKKNRTIQKAVEELAKLYVVRVVIVELLGRNAQSGATRKHLPRKVTATIVQTLSKNRKREI
jgi:hypothetical protein